MKVVTIEGLSDDLRHPLQVAWVEADVPQCGYCQSGQIMAAAVLLRETQRPTEFGSYVAHVAEVSVSDAGQVRVHRVAAAIDCGPVVNPDTIRAQLEGGTAFGLTAALYGEISFEKGRVKQRNFHDYPVLRINEMPVVEAHIVPSVDKMGGVGEPGVPSVAPAAVNAIFAATGKRLRRLPIRAAELKKA
jgi:isoquinoline 1-oxidoreductase beta subunit